MPSAIPHNSNVYTDLSSLKELKGKVNSGDSDAIEQVAQQFEAIFIQMMLSGMRKTIEVNEEYGNDKSMYYDLFDKQVAMNLSASGGIGLARTMMLQGGEEDLKLSNTTQSDSIIVKKTVIEDDAVNREKLLTKNSDEINVIKSSIQTDKAQLNFNSPMEFIQTIWDLAKDVIKESGLNPKAILAQAALETGWGKSIIKSVSGDSSFNLFGIKSDQGWKGEQTVANTLEYADGVMKMSREEFRSYDSIKESVQDYVNFLKSNQRYSEVLKQSSNPNAYVTELQKAGYATDPDYATKIQSIMRRPEFNQLFNSTDLKDI